MTVIAHVSDLHFGTEDPAAAAGLLAELDGSSAAVPALVAVSGDLTQRAKRTEFEAARRFLDRLPGPHLVVPGNHDVPLYAVIDRFFRPYARYRKYLTRELSPFIALDEVAVAGVNTAYGALSKNGRITREQTDVLCSRFGGEPRRWKVLVAHHPFELDEADSANEVVNGAAPALASLETCKLDVILSGHLHVAATRAPAARQPGHRIVSIHAGTSISTRLRGEPNGYNRLEFAGDLLTVTHRRWNGSHFVAVASKEFRRGVRDAA